MKIAIPPEELQKLIEEIKRRTQVGVKNLIADMFPNKVQELVETKLKSDSAKKNWLNGFHFETVVEGESYLVALTGKLALWMEDGFKPGEISNAILNGSRAKYNKETGKKYVDVPLPASGISIQKFRNADEAIQNVKPKEFTATSPGGSIGQAGALNARVKDIIKSQAGTNIKPSYLTIKRVTQDSKWPEQGWDGAQIFKALEEYFAQHVHEYVQREF
jgi:hypothetical protein